MVTAENIPECSHLEVDRFESCFVVDGMGKGKKTRVVTLQHCTRCGRYLTADGKAVPEELIVGRANVPKEGIPNARTLVVNLNSDVYDKLVDLVDESEVSDPTKLMSEVVGLGIVEFRRNYLFPRTG
jgi:ABC-type ATPase with predicted acetyltransferase domain